ncbi:TspO/MBR family protein [Falsirhodobacter xinxiangensis]|uniref:TspO/MBR family protein n=1 Tax=Falsirhodobacter xinxiangensis TaxID=2530049 RepID=UPI0010AA15BC|nr:TspO/MBR family protein [Rhodobacter xinxiangensis]
MKTLMTYLFFIAIVLAGGLYIGTTYAPGEWYAALRKPVFTPPNAWFPIVWTTLYVLIGIAGARAWRLRGPILLWVLQLALNFAWTPVFFGAHEMTAGLGIIALLWITVIAFIIRAWRSDKVSSLLFVPYALWVTVAMALNGALILLN